MPGTLGTSGPLVRIADPTPHSRRTGPVRPTSNPSRPQGWDLAAIARRFEVGTSGPLVRLAYPPCHSRRTRQRAAPQPWKARAPYRGIGYERVGTRTFQVGGQLYDDLILGKPLA